MNQHDEQCEEVTGLRLKLLRGEELVAIISGATVADVRDDLIEWLDEKPLHELDGVYVEECAGRRCTLSFTTAGVVLTTSRQWLVYEVWAEARNVFASYAVRGQHAQWM
jgi:hypothetical protein